MVAGKSMLHSTPLSMVKEAVEFGPGGDYLIYAFGSDSGVEHE